MKLKHTLIALPLALGLSFAAHAAPVNLVSNEGFESSGFGWTRVGLTGFSGVAPHSGSLSASLGGNGSLGSFSQSLATNTGASYDISFWLKESVLTPNSFRVLWNDVAIIDFTLTNVAENLTWQQLSALAVVTASSSNSVIKFEGTATGLSSFRLDDISVTETANTPEAPAVMMTLLGLAGLAAAKRKRHAV